MEIEEEKWHAHESAVASSSSTSSMEDDHSSSHESVAELQQPSGGMLIGWGSGMFGLLGRDDEVNVTVPTPLPNFSALVTSVAVGATHALTIGSDGSLFSWGANDDWQLGLGDTSKKFRSKPTELPSLQTRQIVAAAAGYAHSLALSGQGEVLAFGQGEMAQLGLTLKKRPLGSPPDLSAHPVPALVKELSNLTRIIQVACGENHSLALSSAGRVYAVGDGSRGALGLDFKNSPHLASGAPEGSGVRVAVFTEVSSLLPLPIAVISAGSHHSLFVSAGGSVYSSGDAGKGRLGYSTTTPQWLPRRVLGALEDKHVILASGGNQFSLFLTQDYLVYAAGANSHGEAGLDPADVKQLDSPTLVPGLPPILQVSAGATHALARDHLNRVWSWGSGELGELGRGADYLRNSTSVGLVSLPSVYPRQHLVSVAAGSNTSFAIVAQTVLTTVSRGGPSTPNRVVANSASASSSSPTTPAASYALSSPTFNFRAVSASASSSSSANIVPAAPSSPRFLVAPSASPLSLNAFSYTHFSNLIRRQDWASLGGYISYCFSSALILNASFLPRASVGGGSAIDHNLLELVYSKILKASLSHPKLQGMLTASIQRCISSMVALMKVAARKPPQDLVAYRAVFICFQSPHFIKAGLSETAQLTDLAYIITRMPREVSERVQSYLYQNVPLELFKTRFIKILLQNIERRMQQALHGSPIDNRLMHSTEEMQDLVRILASIHTVTERRINARRALRGKHHGIGLALDTEAGRTSPDATSDEIPDSAWHLPIDRYMSLAYDLAAFVSPAPTAAQVPAFSFMRYPWMLSPSTKAAYLRTEFAQAMNAQALGFAIQQMTPYLALTIRRSHIIDDTVAAINSHSPWELRRPLKITFLGAGGVPELGEDQGGLSNEFFELALQQLFLPQYGLWEVRQEWKTVWFSSLPTDPSKQALYECFGILLGMLVYNSASTNLPFPIWLWAQLLGLPPTLEHLHAVDPQLADSLEELLSFEGDIENVFCLTFSVDVPEVTPEEQQALMEAAGRVVQQNSLFALPAPAPEASASSTTAPAPAENAEMKDASLDTCAITVPVASSSSSASAPSAVVVARRTRMRTIPLIAGGESISVTQQNKAEYVRLYLHYLMSGSVADAIQPLIRGFQQICSVSRKGGGQGYSTSGASVSMSLFSPSDLELVVVGAPLLNFKELEKGTRYEGGFGPAHKTVRDFWAVVHEELTDQERRALLLFTTGTSRAPVSGLRDTRLLIQRAGPDTESLPTSSTCFHALILPEYATKAKLTHKLKLALANAVGFGLR